MSRLIVPHGYSWGAGPKGPAAVPPAPPPANPIPGLEPVAYFKKNTGVTEVAGVVTNWADQSGNGHDAARSADSGAGGPVLQGDGSILCGNGAFEAGFSTAGFTLAQPCTLAILYKALDWGNTRCLLSGIGGAVAVRQAGSSPGLDMYAGGAACADAGPADGVLAAVRAIFNGAGSSLTVDGGAPAGGDPGGNNPSGVGIAHFAPAFNSSWAHIYVSEVIAFDRALSDADWAAILTYWATL